MITLWAKRWSTARGWAWVRCNEYLIENQDIALAAWQRSEPTVEFKFSVRKPR